MPPHDLACIGFFGRPQVGPGGSEGGDTQIGDPQGGAGSTGQRAFGQG